MPTTDEALHQIRNRLRAQLDEIHIVLREQRRSKQPPPTKPKSYSEGLIAGLKLGLTAVDDVIADNAAAPHGRRQQRP